MQIVGYVIGGLIIGIAIFLIVKNVIDIVRVVKDKKSRKNGNSTILEETKDEK